MISKNIKKYCYEDPSLIENYDLAIADKENVWHCHHKVETIMNCSQRELIAKDCFYNRPAHELIFLTTAKHISVHMTGKKYSEQHRQHMRESHLGKAHHVSKTGMANRIAAVKAAITKTRIKVKRPFTVVCQYSKDNRLIAEYKNVYTAAVALGVSKTAVQRKIACQDVVRQSKLSDYVFKREIRYKDLEVIHPRENDVII